MGRIRSDEPAAVRNAKLMAKLYYYMAKEMIDRLGKEEGSKAIKAAVTAFGNDRVASMKEEAAERGIEKIDSVLDYFKVRDMPSDGWINTMEPPTCQYCPLHDIWNDFGELGNYVGSLYCDVDYILFEGFGFKLSRENCLTTGDKYCDFILR
ncbi:L-2-amino-thiazoline-4-carboxylic acid hydrolase [Lutispora sp.]|uniref:L-2-amino-thiazoline-4-carboxylic acid hydrolase n=1 Tax=Lutispora sp. TaxID=2828727 RepID=UPI002B1F1367|nr:L-2-amino-thiazoline-4-carboxylic acid hydrolase [Lutispora sp.]MEA4960567.1 L-2-amino-thiazoline-4-carboxylic acid hydrolase [Lutispora sp.]